MKRLYLVAIIGITLVGVIMIPSMLTGIVFHEYFYAKECFDTKEFQSRAEAEQEYDRWKNALGDKFAGGGFRGLADKSLNPTPLSICVFTNK